jgi:benzoate membrane transport protein
VHAVARQPASVSVPIMAGVVAAVVGYLGSFPVVLAGLTAVGASHRQASSGLFALAVTMGFTALTLSVRTRMPISVAWSTPGAALLAATARPAGGFATAVEAFTICGGLIVLTGLCRPAVGLLTRIPAPLSAAMLAGVLLPICMNTARSVVRLPRCTIPAVVAWLILSRVARRWAVPGALLAAGCAVALLSHGKRFGAFQTLPTIAIQRPHGHLLAAITLAIPLFVVTMASQNLPGLAVLTAQGYRPPLRSILVGTGGATLVAAPLGGHAINAAALIAAMVSGPEAGPDASRRWIAAASSGVTFMIFGLGTGIITSLAAFAPLLLIEAIAGLALLGTVRTALLAAVADPTFSEPAVVTFVVTASSISFCGISASFWGLVAGLVVVLSRRVHSKPFKV